MRDGRRNGVEQLSDRIDNLDAVGQRIVGRAFRTFVDIDYREPNNRAECLAALDQVERYLRVFEGRAG